MPVYAVDDQFPVRSRRKSVFLIERFMRLRTEEAIAARWHMGGCDESVNGRQLRTRARVREVNPLAVKLHLSDLGSDLSARKPRRMSMKTKRNFPSRPITRA